MKLRQTAHYITLLAHATLHSPSAFVSNIGRAIAQPICELLYWVRPFRGLTLASQYGILERLFLAVIIVYCVRIYKSQTHWLDRQIARLFRYIKSLFKRKGQVQ